MRAWTIVIFILAFQASLAMLNMSNPLNTGMGVTVDTSNKYTITPVAGNSTFMLPQPNGGLYNNTGNATNPDYTTQPAGFSPLTFQSGFIESILGMTGPVGVFVNVLYQTIFAISITFSPYIGSFNANMLQGLSLFILGIGLFQIFSGRSLKTSE